MVATTTSILAFFKPVRSAATSTAAETSSGDASEHAAATAHAPVRKLAHNTRKRGRQEPTKSGERSAQPRVNESSVKRDGDASLRHDEEHDEAAATAVDALNKKRVASESKSVDGSSSRAAKATEELSAYEQKRLARIAQNAVFLQQLGVKPARAPAERKPKREPNTVLALPVPARRSRRLQSEAAEHPVGDDSLSKTHSQERSKGGEPDLPPLPDSFDDSSVLRYTCEGTKKKKKKKKSGDGASSADEAADASRGVDDQHEASAPQALVGFSFDASVRAMTDPQLKKVYSLSFSPFRENGLIAAGGHQGYVSIYPMESEEPIDETSVQAQDEAESRPLMSFRAHAGWISSVSLSKSVQSEKRNILLTASNDSFVKVWDLNQQSSDAHKTAKEVYTTSSLHRKGIFSMDTHDDSLLTCSKDNSVVLSTFRDNSCALEVVHRFEDHGGVVKSVSFSQAKPSQFASGGNNRALRVFDVRIPDTSVLEIRNAHSRAINSVQWHPRDANLVLTASFDPDMHLFDMRKPSLPLFTFRGHYLDNFHTAIYHPAFVENGDAIVAAGGSRCQDVSLYKTSDGSTISRGYIGMKADYIVADPFQERILIASGRCLEFADFKRVVSRDEDLRS